MTKEQFLSKIYANEDAFTAAVHTYINHNYPEMRGFYFHVANETIGGMAIIQKRKAMGVLAGVPDFEFKKPYTWYLELKIEKGVLSPAQKKLHKEWTENGEIIETAYTPQQVITIIDKHLIF